MHFVQDIPTPHNNILLKALRRLPEIDLHIWYARLTHPQYSFPPDLASEAGEPIVYGHRRPNWQLVKLALTDKTARFFVVGWMNPTTRLLLPLFWLTGRPFNMWFDMPAERQGLPFQTLLRSVYYWLLKRSNAKVFAVGKNTLLYFKRKGFSDSRLVNLPISVGAADDLDVCRRRRAEIRKKYGVLEGDLFVVTGSRLIFEKGFDLLITGVSKVREELRCKIKVLVVGKGPEKAALSGLASELGLTDAVFMEDWMSSDDFMAHLCAADLSVHPARFDAYGGITLSAMLAGVPVLGSSGAGSAVDRLDHGVNGWLYEADDVYKLAFWLERAISDRACLVRMGEAAGRTAKMHGPEAGAGIIAEQAI